MRVPAAAHWAESIELFLMVFRVPGSFSLLTASQSLKTYYATAAQETPTVPDLQDWDEAQEELMGLLLS